MGVRGVRPHLCVECAPVRVNNHEHHLLPGFVHKRPLAKETPALLRAEGPSLSFAAFLCRLDYFAIGMCW